MVRDGAIFPLPEGVRQQLSTQSPSRIVCALLSAIKTSLLNKYNKLQILHVAPV
jgi:hypothetical protein